jgi:hypothetical protein
VKAVTSVASVRPTVSKGSLDQRVDIGLSPADSAKDLAAAVNRLDVADADFQVAFAGITAAYEG